MRPDATPFEIGQSYTRRDIHARLGGGVQGYLPTKAGRVVCGAFRKDTNPEAPHVILVGTGPQIMRSAELLLKQDSPIPVCLKHRTNDWRYHGMFVVSRVERRPEAVDDYARRANRLGDVTMVLFLEPVDRSTGSK